MADRGYWYSSLYFLSEADEDTVRENKDYVEEVFSKVLTDSIRTAFKKKRVYLNNDSVRYHLAKTRVLQKKYVRANELLLDIDKKHYFYPDAQRLLGDLAYKFKKYTLARTNYKRCFFRLRKKASKNEYEELLQTYCMLNLARTYFSQKQYDKSIKIFDLIKNTDYFWPETLRDKAWAYYYLGDINKSLGLLNAYSSDLLAEYRSPEILYMKSIFYHDLCLWQDAVNSTQEYLAEYKQNYKIIADSVNRNDLYRLVAYNQKLEGSDLILKKYVRKIRKTPWFFDDINSLRQVRLEAKSMKRFKHRSARRVVQFLEEVEEGIKKRLSQKVRLLARGLKRQILYFDDQIVNLRLSANVTKRDLLAADEKAATKIQTGDKENLSITPDKSFYTFKGAYWVDELGGYTYALKSRCDEKREVANE